MATPIAAPPPQQMPVGPDTLITVKVVIDGNNRRFKLALRDLGANVLPQKLRFLLAIPAETRVTFERYSDSAGTYIALDSNNPAIYKQLYRAAKAKLKLRLRATIHGMPTAAGPDLELSRGPPRHSYLDTVLSPPPPPAKPAPYQNYNASQATLVPQPLINFDDAPRAPEPPKPSAPLHVWTGCLRPDNLSRATLPTIQDFHGYASAAFCIDCNHCGKSIPNEHFHCSICEDGDFDLCQTCVGADITCPGEGHWLIKRVIKSGVVVSSVTETIAPKKLEKTEEQAKAEDAALAARFQNLSMAPGRTCNSCIGDFSADIFVTCDDCPDFDLCVDCFAHGAHGHDPSHKFEAVSNDSMEVLRVQHLLAPGRGTIHAATCDGCDKTIIGVRHKCLTCPDWDFCSNCVLSAKQIHAGHRFAPLYKAIADPSERKERHYGIYCDGPLCSNARYRSYISGTRYKCAVCHDTDFCANCEAIPSNDHNKTHPLIKFKTPVRHVSVTTLGEEVQGGRVTLGDQQPRACHASTETVSNSSNAATQVQTVAEVKPDETKEEVKKPASPAGSIESGKMSNLQAHFEKDTTPDGTSIAPGRLVSQSWTLRNPGPQAWPAGCAVYYIGGDDMRNIDNTHPSSTSTIEAAGKSNVIDHQVSPDETAEFKVTLKAPAKSSRHISYWRLKTPEGLPFGHKLWVDIVVADEPVVEAVTEEAKVEEPKNVIKEESVASSQVIFPKLDKESPASSVHVDAAPIIAPSVETPSQLEDDIESLELESDSEDGFATDEEYDILDASDEDFLDAQSKK